MTKLSFFLIFLLCPVLLLAEQFPLCIYSVGDAKYLKTIKKAGFNCAQTYNNDPSFLKNFAETAQKNNLEIVIKPDLIIGSSLEKEAQKWPVKAWYIYDEPDIARLSSSKLKKLEQNAKQAFPNKKTAFVLSKGSSAANYYSVADIIMVDWYPVPHLALTSFGENIKTARKIMDKNGYKNKPLWGVAQSFDWKTFKQYYPDDKRIGRFPEVWEMRFMAYHGLLEGMEGVFFFTFNHNKVPLPESKPEYWKRLTAVSKELKQILPIFEGGEKLDSPFAGKSILAQRRLYKGQYYDILLNTSSEEEPLPEPLQNKKYKAVFGKKLSVLAAYSPQIFKSKAEN